LSSTTQRIVRFDLPGILAKLDEFHRRAVMDDHCCPHSIGRGTRFDQDFFAFECLVKIVHFKGNVGHSSNPFGHRAILFEPHPLDSVGTCLKARHVQFQVLEVSLPRPRGIMGYTDMVVTPTSLSDGRWGFVI